MRTLVVYLTLVILLLLSVGAGFVASDWPNWCSRAHWCRADGAVARHAGPDALARPPARRHDATHR